MDKTPEFDCYSTDDEVFHDGGKDEALQDLDDDGRLEVGAEFRLGVTKTPDPASFFDVNWLIEEMQVNASDNHGDCAEDYLADLTQDQIKELDGVVKAWLQTNAEVRFYSAEGIETFLVTQEDIDGFRHASIQQGEGGAA